MASRPKENDAINRLVCAIQLWLLGDAPYSLKEFVPEELRPVWTEIVERVTYTLEDKMIIDMDELRELCKHPYIRERRKAILILAQKMQEPDYRADARALLEDRAQNDEIGNMRTLAQSVLDHFLNPNTPLINPDRKHIFAVSCPHCQRICYFDKRKAVKERPIFMAATMEHPLDTLYLHCTHCGKALTAEVDLEGYK